MKNDQKGFVVPLLILIIVLLVIGGGYYVYSNKNSQQKDMQNDIPTSVETNNEITLEDILKVSYPIYVNDNGKAGSEHETVFAGLGTSYKVTIDRIGEDRGSGNPVEIFWIYKYEFTDSSHTSAKVFIGGSFGASGTDDRIFDLTKINGKISVKAESSI